MASGRAASGRGSDRGAAAETLLCEACGYELGGSRSEDVGGGGEWLCPECGRPASESDPSRRNGTAWQNGPGLGAWARTGLGVLTRPRRGWAATRVEAASGRGLAALNAAATGALAAAVPAGALRDVGLFLTIGPALALLVFGLTFVETLGIRFWGRVHGFRVTRAVAWSVCGHASFGWVVGGGLAGAAWVVGQLDAVGSGYTAFGAGRVLATAPVAQLGLIVLAAVVGMLLFETLTYLGVRRMRYANQASTSPGAG